MSRRATFTLSSTLMVLASACGGGDGDHARPVLDQVAPAVAAVEDELGGPQQYFEVNATPQLVNLFVAVDDAAQVAPYVYVGGELAPAAEPAGAEGSTFGADALAFDPDTVLDGIAEELPDADVVLFVVTGGPGGAVEHRARVVSDDGGTLEVVVGADGSVRSVDPSG